MNRTYRLSAAGLVFAGLIAAGSGMPVLAATPVEEAQTLITQGDLDGALKRIDRFLSSSPQDAEGRFTRALILVKQNKNADAIKAFTDLTRDYPQLPEPYNNLAVLYAQTGDYEKARDALEAALATNPSYATAHENLGDIYAALAGAAYNRALALDAGNTTTRYKLALLGDLTAGPSARPGTTTAAAATPPPAVATAPAATPAPATAANDPALKALDAWAAAWTRRDVDAYLAAYAPDFKPDGGLSLGEWREQRRARIGKAKSIAVAVVNPEITRIDAQHLSVSFMQDYSSDTISDKVIKIIELEQVGGSWKISRETLR
ncbi:tetratricopeptide repeat protein [Nevskia sp.]|uniref:L,D-transpeptidase Cds6 family protein n=1 Tax=Nevskia sp. TaxID=1929292 RepID=UPI0025DE8059|nr:tetratricopeptide repeat protein [Nevskia sp.]